MELVVDANIVISALIAPEGKTREVLFLNSMQYSAPEFLLEECRKYTEEIAEKAELTQKDIDDALSLLSSKIQFIPFQEFEHFLQEARKICTDPKDEEYLALALARKIPLWTDDKDLHKQSVVKVYSTSTLLKELELI